MAALDMVKNKLRTLSDQLAKITDERDDFKLKFDAEKNARETCESEIAGLNRRIQLLEEDLERSEERLSTAQTKLDEASKAADESERAVQVLRNRSSMDDDRICDLEQKCKDAELFASESQKKYDETVRRLKVVEHELGIAEETSLHNKRRAKQLEEEMTLINRNLKTLQIKEVEASQREDSYEETIRDLTHRLKEAENRTECAERECNLLHKGKAVLEGDLEKEQLKTKKLQEEMQQTYMEIHELMQ
ncbi:Hypothetical predicted protein [Octopus vulgaris]|uniref:Tropomyosin Tod p 1.0102 n=1 Tax=Octopus vulgaris TaxID=6645 RepID=A0AA36ATW4_OCTVU|nr:Hypothetical predicted protein [Octopus vulgaris]